MEWAVVADDLTAGAASGLAYRIRKGLGAWIDGPFEARAVGPAGGLSSKVYARYVGEVTE